MVDIIFWVTICLIIMIGLIKIHFLLKEMDEGMSEICNGIKKMDDKQRMKFLSILDKY